MERVLKYFLEVAREESISRAAEKLHISQPTISRQLRELEEQLGKTLFIREPRRIVLTEEGRILRRRAEEILTLIEKTKSEIKSESSEISGDIYIGVGETKSAHVITRTAAKLIKRYKNIRVHIISGDTVDVLEELESGLIDFGMIFYPIDHTRYEVMDIEEEDKWGILLPRDSRLAKMSSITREDLKNSPLIVSRHSNDSDVLKNWFGMDMQNLNIVATYNLAYNASLMVEDGVGYAICLEGIINTENSNLVFRELSPLKSAKMGIIWKKNPVFSKAAESFLEFLKDEI